MVDIYVVGALHIYAPSVLYSDLHHFGLRGINCEAIFAAFFENGVTNHLHLHLLHDLSHLSSA